jgi:hypothetical protein
MVQEYCTSVREPPFPPHSGVHSVAPLRMKHTEMASIASPWRILTLTTRVTPVRFISRAPPPVPPLGPTFFIRVRP